MPKDKPAYDYFEVKSCIHACGEAHARWQQAVQLTRAAEAQLQSANAELVAVWKKTGLTGQPTDYRFDNATKTIVRAKDETQPETTTP